MPKERTESRRRKEGRISKKEGSSNGPQLSSKETLVLEKYAKTVKKDISDLLYTVITYIESVEDEERKEIRGQLFYEMEMFKNFRDLVINKPYREHYRNQSRKILQPASSVVTNIGKCKKVIRSAGTERVCGNSSFVYWMAQTRSGDEGMTVFTQCTVCRSIKKS